MTSETTSCKLRKDTLKRIALLGHKGDSYDMIINRVLDNYEKAIKGRIDL